MSIYPKRINPVLDVYYSELHSQGALRKLGYEGRHSTIEALRSEKCHLITYLILCGIDMARLWQ